MRWTIADPTGAVVARVEWTGGMVIRADAEPRVAAYLESCAQTTFSLLRATGTIDSDVTMIGRMLDVLFAEQLVAASHGSLRGTRGDSPELDADPVALAAATTSGRTVWTPIADGYRTGAAPGQPGLSAQLTRRGRSFTLVIARGGVALGPPNVQKNGWLGKRCELAELWERITTPPQWAPPGKRVATLGEPVIEPRAREHLTSGRRVGRARFGDYHVVVVDVTGAPGTAVHYTFRAFVSPSEGAAPVLVVSHERSMFGTVAFGVHRGAQHTHYGEAPAVIGLADFETKAREILASELLGA